MNFFTTKEKLANPKNSVFFNMLKQRGFKISSPKSLWDSYFDKEYGLVWGKQSFCEYVAQEMNWNLFSHSPDWLVKLPWSWTKRNPIIQTLGELKRMENSSSPRIPFKRYLAPADDFDVFPAGEYNNYPDVPNEVLVIKDTPQDWSYKASFLIKDKAIEDWYCYKYFGTEDLQTITNQAFAQPKTGSTPKDFLEGFLSANQTAPGCIIDVGYIDKIGFAIIDSKPIYCSDINYFNEHKFYTALMRAVQFVR